LIVIIKILVFTKWFVKKCDVDILISVSILDIFPMVQGWEVGWGFTKQSPCCLLEGSPLSYLTSERERIQFKIVSPVNRDSNRVQDRILKEPWGAQHNMFFTGSCLQCLLYTFPYTLCGRLFSVYALWLALFRIRFVAGSFPYTLCGGSFPYTLCGWLFSVYAFWLALFDSLFFYSVFH